MSRVPGLNFHGPSRLRIIAVGLLTIFSGCNQGNTAASKNCAKAASAGPGTPQSGGTTLKWNAPRPLRPDSEITVATARQVREGLVVPGSYIVAFRGDLGSTQLRFSTFRGEHHHFYPDLARRFLGDSRVKDLDYITTINLHHPSDEFKGDTTEGAQRKAFAPSLSRPKTLADVAQLPWQAQDLPEMPALLSKVEFHSPELAIEALDEWEKSGEIWYAEPDGLSELSQVSDETVDQYTKAASTAMFGWHATIKLPQALAKLAKIKAPPAIDPVIAVIDSGVDYEHPLLKDRIWVNPVPGAAGCGEDVYGCDLTAKVPKGELGIGTPHPYNTTGPGEACAEGDKDCPHGTHVAGIIAARLATEGNTAGGVCPVCKIMPLKIIARNPKGSGTASDTAIIKSLKYLVAFGSSDRKLVRVANSSFGKYGKNRSLGLLIAVLRNAPYETLVVGAAGNEDSMARSYPAAFADAVAVASIKSAGSGAPAPEGKASYSNFGPWVDVAAPGGLVPYDISSTVPGGGSRVLNGTSMASPVVAGVAGLILAMYNQISFTELRERIVGLADPRIYSSNVNAGINYSCYNPKFQSDSNRRKLLGTGVVDADKALGTGSEFVQDSGYNSRVLGGCAVIGRGRHQGFDMGYGTLLLLFLPLAVVLVHRRTAPFIEITWAQRKHLEPHPSQTSLTEPPSTSHPRCSGRLP